MKTTRPQLQPRSFPRTKESNRAAYEVLADEMVARADRIPGTLEDRQRGIARMQEILAVYEQILRDERLRA
jgi:hypothetical protein